MARERVGPGEVAALTARLRALSAAGAGADEEERARFLRDKEQLLARIEADNAGYRFTPARPGWAGAGDGLDPVLAEWDGDGPPPAYCHYPGHSDGGRGDGDEWGAS